MVKRWKMGGTYLQERSKQSEGVKDTIGVWREFGIVSG